jgi:cytochrome c553
MKRTTQIISGFLAVVALMALIARADNDEEEGEHRRDRHTERRSVAAPTDTTYKAECGSCHMVYPPGLLPARSWIKMMSGLKDHFGENATLDKETSDKIQKILTENAADKMSNRRSQKIAKSIPNGESPLRITETLYFKRQHHEVGKKVWARKSIGSPANCAACHTRAEQGVFSEDEIRIPR